MASVLIKCVPCPGTSGINVIKCGAQSFVLLPEITKQLIKKPTSNVLKIINYTNKAGVQPLASVASSLVTIKESGVHAELAREGLVKGHDYSTKLVELGALGALLKHFDAAGGSNTAELIEEAAAAVPLAIGWHTPSSPHAKKKLKVATAKSDEVPRLTAPYPTSILKQKEEMEKWATDDAMVRVHPSFTKTIARSSFATYWDAGPSAFLQWLHDERKVALENLRFTKHGQCSVFDPDVMASFDEYCKRRRNKTCLRTRAMSLKALILVGKFLIKDDPYDPLRPSTFESFIKALSRKCTGLQNAADAEPKPLIKDTPNWVNARKCRRSCIKVLRSKWQEAPSETAAQIRKRARLGNLYMINAFFTRDATKRQSAIRKLKIHRPGLKAKRTLRLKKGNGAQLEYKGVGSYKVHSPSPSPNPNPQLFRRHTSSTAISFRRWRMKSSPRTFTSL
jgi:hypothetical protein